MPSVIWPALRPLAPAPSRIVLCLAAFLLCAAAARAAPVAWQRFPLPPNCSPGDGSPNATAGLSISCGSYGEFVFGGNAATATGAGGDPDQNCQDQVIEGFEEPRRLPGELGFHPTSGALTPCAGGSCFTGAPAPPWVAVVDWNNHHGFTVGATIAQVADHTTNLALLDLASFTLPEIPANEVSDIQLIAQLCRVVEHADAGNAPLLVNLSLGRVAPAHPCLATPSLGCEVAGLIDHLRAQGVHTVAAAGNHGELLFPASHPGVVAVGAFDLAEFTHSGLARPSELTPAAASSLFPGYGLVLENFVSAGYPLAAGSSYAAAVASGWLARLGGSDRAGLNALLGGASPPALAPVATGYGFALANRGQLVAGGSSFGGDDLVRVALGQRPERFGEANAAHPRIMLVWDVPIGIGWQNSLVRSAALTNRPSPDAEPCVPCRLRRPRQRTLATPTASHEVLILELARSGGLPADRRLTGMFLRVDGEDYVAMNAMDQQLLADLQAGKLVEIELVIARERLPALVRRPVSLRWAMRWLKDDQPFWDATPVAVHLDP